MMSTTQPKMNKKIPNESDVYDRQIRLWGAESQSKMMKSKVLYIHITGVTAEILKNLVLAGIQATLWDPRPATQDQMPPHFFSTATSSKDNDDPASSSSTTTTTSTTSKRFKYSSVAEAVQPQVEELNPLLGTCPILETKTLEELTQDDLQSFTVIVASQIPLAQAVRLSQLTRSMGGSCQLYIVDCFGWNGAAMIDVGSPEWTFRREVGKGLLDPEPLKPYISLEELVQVPLHQCINRFHKTPPSVYLQYRCLLEFQAQHGYFLGAKDSDGDQDDGGKVQEEEQQAVKFWQDYLAKQHVQSLSEEALVALAKAGMAQLAPVCAVMGGLLGNEIIKVISGKGEPANNTILFDGQSSKAWTFLVQPPPP